MKYCKCPKCNKDVSKKTIDRVGICNNCVSLNHIEKYKNDKEYLSSKLINPQYSSYVVELIDFIRKSGFSNVLKYRVVIDFIKVLNEVKGSEDLTESLLDKIYMEKSSIKSIGILEIIKVYLFSKNAFEFELDQQSMYPKNIKPSARYTKDILDYFFDKSRCSDCGTLLTKNTKNNYCYSCIDYRSLYVSTSKAFINEKFNNEKLKLLYIKYIEFLDSLGKSPDLINDVLRKSIDFFYFLESYLPSKFYPNDIEIPSKNLKFIKNNNLYHFNLSEKWIKVFDNKFLNNRKNYFLNFLEYMGLLQFDDNNVKEKILSEIGTLPEQFQKPLQSYLIKFENEIINYKKKNATKEIKWVTVKTKFNEIISLAKWLIEKQSIESWAEVSDKEINIFLLALPEKSRLIRKRTYYNYFEFVLKKKWIFNNPIENFVSRDFKVNTKPLSKKEHAQIYNSILSFKSEYCIEVFTTSLVYFHALTNNQIISIELKDIDLSTKSIIIPNRPPVYLSELELILLTQFLINRDEKLKGRKNRFLYCSYHSISEKSISSPIINKYVKKVTGKTAKDLRIASIQYCSEQFGIEYLHQCLGLSLTQSNRYGDIDDHYIDEIIEDSIENINNGI